MSEPTVNTVTIALSRFKDLEEKEEALKDILKTKFVEVYNSHAYGTSARLLVQAEAEELIRGRVDMLIDRAVSDLDAQQCRKEEVTKRVKRRATWWRNAEL